MLAMLRRSVLLAVLLTSSAAAASDWPGFRGPKMLGVSEDRGLPVEWGPGKNVIWKVKLPGPGASSPVVLGQRIFITCYTDYTSAKGDIKELRRRLVCLDRRTGKQLWEQVVPARLPETEYNRYINEHGYASSTPVTDGQRVYAFFGRSGVLACDLDGNLLWHVEVGKWLNGWGSASSPVVYRDLVIVNASVERSAIVALDCKTGKEVWRAKGMRDSWCTPLIVELPGDKAEVVVTASDALIGIDPERGEQLWRCEGYESANATSTPVARDGIVYATGAQVGGPPLTMAVRAGGRGDVSGTHVVWRQKAGGSHASPVLHGPYLYCVNGFVWCLRADTGKIVYQERLYDSRGEYPSPVLADGKLFAPTRRQGVFVLAAGDKFEQLAHNDLGDKTDFIASPAVSDGQLFLRSNANLYCIGTTAKEASARRPRLRGPQGKAAAIDEQSLPIDLGPTKNVLWKTPASR
jgi:outer membrane protein assembly factor BamB